MENKDLNKILEKIDACEKVIYLDECAAGVLAGDLFVGGVVLDKKGIESLKIAKDSKKLSESKRSLIYDLIVKHCLDFEIVRISPGEIDKINIFNARMLGFQRAIEILHERTGAGYGIIDGNKGPENTCIETDFLVKADGLITGVSCASILAKHSHTLYMKEVCENESFEKYGFLKHKGYGTKIHLEALKKYGPINGFHRQSYKPVRESKIINQ